MRLISRNSHTLALDLFEYLGGGQHLVIALVAVGAEHGSLSPLCGLVAWWFGVGLFGSRPVGGALICGYSIGVSWVCPQPLGV